jgi:pilus assembly protein CpaE
MRTLLVSPARENPVIAQLLGLFESLRRFETPEIAMLDQAEFACQKIQPALVVVVIDTNQLDRTLEVLRRIRDCCSPHVLAVGPATDAKMILRAMQVGADLFLDQDELKSELHAALFRLRVRKTNPDRPGQVLAVLSAGGGCGASTLAVNLAVLLAKERGHCNLIDLNAGKADLAPMLDLKPQYTLSDVCRNDERLDRSMYEKLLARHHSGVALLAAPEAIDEALDLTSQGVARAVEIARETFADVVVDLENCFHADQLFVIEKATRILLVCRLDFIAIRNVRRILAFLASRDIPRERIEVVVNNFVEADQLPVPDAEEAIKAKLAFFVPHDTATIGIANNMGVPAAIAHPEAQVVQSIARIVGLDVPVPPAPTMFDRSLARLREWSDRAMTHVRRRLQSRRANLVPAAPSQPFGMEEPAIHHEPSLTAQQPVHSKSRALSA